ncbi:MAG: endopeptidase La, partial [Clostridia bacterium]|nr:endopeptidase La [Clostridia bacterium]
MLDIFEQKIRTLPLLPLRNLTALPKQTVHLDVRRKISTSAVNTALASDRYIFLATQMDVSEEEPTPEGIYTFGVVAKVQQMMKTQKGDLRVMLEILCRAQAITLPHKEKGHLNVTVSLIPELPAPVQSSMEREALARQAQSLYGELAQYVENISQQQIMEVLSIDDLGFLADYITQNLFLKYQDKQKILEILDPEERMMELLLILDREVEIANLENQISERTKERIAKNQRDFYIREQIHALEEELGEFDPDDEIASYTDKINKSNVPDPIKKKLLKEVERLAKMPIGAQEAGVSRIYLDTCLDLPWGKFTQEEVDIATARNILEQDHYGLSKVKERILETLVVLQKMPQYNGQILCLVGPPGTGKTSVAQSIARATGRNFARVSLGGVHDEAEIRGHRRTYVASMPGKIIEAVREAGSVNPVILLDEVDKIGSDYKGDPASALLEVLDPEQNKTFKDHFLDLPFDLSHVLFILTANTEDTMPRPLLDRTEVIELSSYTQEEKIHIAKEHLIPKQLAKHGLTAKQCKFTDSGLNDLIRSYTREAGVRVLERTLASLCRKALKYLAERPEETKVTFKPANLESFLGPRKFRDDPLSKKDQVGIVTGLAYTAVGGEVMPVEATVMNGSGKIQLTGSLGDVMKESANAAISYIRSKAKELGVDQDFYKNKDIHIHVPEGAVPKDGPSAGVTMTTALVSELTGKKVDHSVAMTGEITLRGRVLPIGGLKEKTMAAYKAGIKKVVLPAANLPDLEEIDPVVKANLEFIPAEHIETVLKTALV